jgi:hypothetical protein
MWAEEKSSVMSHAQDKEGRLRLAEPEPKECTFSRSEDKTQTTVCEMFAKQEEVQAKPEAQAKALLWRAVDFVSKDLYLKLDEFFARNVPVFDQFRYSSHSARELHLLTASP